MNPLLRIQLDIASILESDANFSTIPVFSRAKGVAEQDIENALSGVVAKAGKSGACVIVMMPTVAVPQPDASGPRMETNFLVRVLEIPFVNRDTTSGTGLTAEEISLNVLHLIHGRSVGQGITQLYAASKAAEPVEIEDSSICYDLTFACRFGLVAPNRVTTPTFSGNAAALSIGCNTTAATIYYTTDGSFPWLGNTAATKYGITITAEDGTVIVTENGDPLITPGPFSVSTGTTVRAAAYATNYQASDAASITL